MKTYYVNIERKHLLDTHFDIYCVLNFQVPNDSQWFTEIGNQMAKPLLEDLNYYEYQVSVREFSLSDEEL